MREASTSGTKLIETQENFEEKLNRPTRMLRSERLYELYEEAKICENPERMEQLILEIKIFGIKIK